MTFRKYFAVIIIGITAAFLVYLSVGIQDTTQSYAPEIMSKCDIDMDCTTDYLTDLAKTEKQSTILITFDELVSSYDKTTVFCHSSAHHLGMFLYHYIGDLEQSRAYTDQRCGGSLIHGVIEEFLLTDFNSKDIADVDVNQICPINEENPYDIERIECAHGLGHGVAKLANHDVFSAVKVCDKFEFGLEQMTCSKGVFMENLEEYTESGSGSFDEEDLFYPCNEVDSIHMPPCYHYHTTYMFMENDSNRSKTFKDCDNMATKEFIRYCYSGMGRQLADSVLLFDDFEDSSILCLRGNPQYQTFCYDGITNQLADQKGSDKAMDYCKILPEQFKADCYDRVGVWVQLLHPGNEEQECSKAETNYFDTCMNANFENVKIL